MKNVIATYTLSKKRQLGILLLYFVGHLFVIPLIAAIIMNAINSKSTLLINLLVYVFTVIPMIIVALPLLKKERHMKMITFLKSAVISMVVLIALNFILSNIINILFGLETSANQEGVEKMSTDSLLGFVFVTVILAPIVEELTFRGVIFKVVRKQKSFIIAALVSGLLFGLIHVLSSLLLGNFADFVYIVLYAGLGVVFCKVYEDTGSIYGAILIHGLYNCLGLLAML